MKNKYRILKILVVLVLFAFLLSFSLKRFSSKEQRLRVDFVEATPVYFVNENSVKATVKKMNPSGKVGNVDIPVIEKHLNEMPAVENANVYLNLNGVMNVEVKQRVPVMRIVHGKKDFYLDKSYTEFPISNLYSHPCMLVSGNIPQKDYKDLVILIEKLSADDFDNKYFIGITRTATGDYELLTYNGMFSVELGDLKDIDFKLKGFKTFAQKYLVEQDANKYKKISLKYKNQVVTTLRRGYKPYEDNLENKEKLVKKDN